MKIRSNAIRRRGERIAGSSNAQNHAANTVTIALSEQADEISLTVTDDGPGVPPEYQERIFERFTRVEDARTRNDGGTGLGLAIARDIISDHGGTIRYDGKYKPGARFVIELPVNR